MGLLDRVRVREEGEMVGWGFGCTAGEKRDKVQYPVMSVRTAHRDFPGDNAGKLCCILLSLFLPLDDDLVKGKLFPL